MCENCKNLKIAFYTIKSGYRQFSFKFSFNDYEKEKQFSFTIY